MRKLLITSRTLLAVTLFVTLSLAQTATKPATKAAARPKAAAVSPVSKVDPAVLQRNIRAHLEFLASDALQGRGSGTQYELLAGTYIASQLRQFGIEPAGDADTNGQKGFIQRVPMEQTSFTEPPTLTAGSVTLTHGKDMAVVRAQKATFSGSLQRLKAGDKVQPGAVVYIHLKEGPSDPPVRTQFNDPLSAGAIAVIVADAAQTKQRYTFSAGQVPELPVRLGSAQAADASGGSAVILNAEATKQFDGIADGTQVTFSGKTAASTAASTWNVIGVLPGNDPKLSKEVILLTAHMDHLGLNEKTPGPDKIFNGADDDASGVVAVLELARMMGAGPRNKRTVYFALFGSEERGGFGAQHFLNVPPLPLTDIVANLEFEMIGRPDSAVAADALWLTGYERTNLGPELASRGAKIVADPHPDQNFFRRSDNYALARRGIVAQTVSSFGLHKDYHQPSDDISHIDFDHMTHAIQSMLAPVLWLANSDFKPEWKEGMKP